MNWKEVAQELAAELMTHIEGDHVDCDLSDVDDCRDEQYGANPEDHVRYSELKAVWESTEDPLKDENQQLRRAVESLCLDGDAVCRNWDNDQLAGAVQYLDATVSRIARKFDVELEDAEDVPCVQCGRTDLPLHYNRECPNCFTEPEE